MAGSTPGACNGTWPDAFHPGVDVISLHYDCAPDPDDFESAVADRSILELRHGAAWLREHALAVGGTFGAANARLFQQAACERVLGAVWGTAGGFLRAGASAELGDDAAAETARLRAEAGDAVGARWARAVSAGGAVYVKEGGQSDFTALALARLEARLAGASGCVHVVQHSAWNEAHASAAALQYVRSRADYVTIDDGNAALQRPTRDPACDGCLRPVPARFEPAALRSWLGCAWAEAFRAFSALDSWCPDSPRRASAAQCVDFSDTHALAYILRIAPLTMERFIDEYLDAPAARALAPVECARGGALPCRGSGVTPACVRRTIGAAAATLPAGLAEGALGGVLLLLFCGALYLRWRRRSRAVRRALDEEEQQPAVAKLIELQRLRAVPLPSHQHDS